MMIISVTVPPSQSCGAVPLNDPLKTRTPARYRNNCYHNSIASGIGCANMYSPKGCGLQDQMLSEMSERGGR